MWKNGISDTICKVYVKLFMKHVHLWKKSYPITDCTHYVVNCSAVISKVDTHVEVTFPSVFLLKERNQESCIQISDVRGMLALNSKFSKSQKCKFKFAKVILTLPLKHMYNIQYIRTYNIHYKNNCILFFIYIESLLQSLYTFYMKDFVTNECFFCMSLILY